MGKKRREYLDQRDLLSSHIYFWVQADGQIFLLFAYAKNERANVTPNEACMLRACAGL